MRKNCLLYNAIEVQLNDETLVLEVMQHLGDNTVRCISMHPTDGLKRGMKATDTGKSIAVPVGKEVLGRMVNILGEPIDNKPRIETKEKWSIHRDPPPLKDQVAEPEMLETGIKAIDLLCPLQGGKIGLLVELEWKASYNGIDRSIAQDMVGILYWSWRTYREIMTYYDMQNSGVIDKTSLVFGQMNEPQSSNGRSYRSDMAEYFEI